MAWALESLGHPLALCPGIGGRKCAAAIPSASAGADRRYRRPARFSDCRSSGRLGGRVLALHTFSPWRASEFFPAGIWTGLNAFMFLSLSATSSRHSRGRLFLFLLDRGAASSTVLPWPCWHELRSEQEREPHTKGGLCQGGKLARYIGVPGRRRLRQS